MAANMTWVVPIGSGGRLAADSLRRWHARTARAEGFAEMLGILVAKSALRPGLDPKRANDLLLLFAGEDVYSALVGTAGWTHEAWVDWTVAALAHHLFGIEP